MELTAAPGTRSLMALHARPGPLVFHENYSHLDVRLHERDLKWNYFGFLEFKDRFAGKKTRSEVFGLAESLMPQGWQSPVGESANCPADCDMRTA
jgi:hypothetical protein